MNSRRLKIFISLTLILILGAFSFWFWYYNNSSPLWSEENIPNDDLEESSLDYHADILEEYFLYDRLGESLHYKLKPSFKTNSKEAQLEMRNAFNQALNEVFEGRVRPAEAMIILAQGSLFEKFNRSFLKALHGNDIKSGQIHWSLQFLPKQHLNLNYNMHIENNQVVEWRPNEKWLSVLKEKDLSLETMLNDLTIPGNGRAFQYLAGSIHYHINLDKVESPNERLGALTFRKHYRVNDDHSFSRSFDSSGFKLEHMRLKSKTSLPLITVDILETFTLQELAPQLKIINLNFSGVVEELSSQSVNLNPGNNLTIVGELDTEKEKQVLFEMNLTNLSFDIEKNIISKLNEQNTLYEIKILPKELSLENTSLFKHQIKNKILREHQRDLLKSLNAALFSNKLMGEVKR